MPLDDAPRRRVPEDATHVFCETLTANVWHIHPLTEAGPKFGGGADTPALCGFHPLWDIDRDINEPWPFGNLGICRKCAAAFSRIAHA